MEQTRLLYMDRVPSGIVKIICVGCGEVAKDWYAMRWDPNSDRIDLQGAYCMSCSNKMDEVISGYNTANAPLSPTKE